MEIYWNRYIAAFVYPCDALLHIGRALLEIIMLPQKNIKFLRSRVSIFSIAINLITRSVLLNFHQRIRKRRHTHTNKQTSTYVHTHTQRDERETNPNDLKYIYVENVISTQKQWPINQVRMIYAALSSFSLSHSLSLSFTRSAHIVAYGHSHNITFPSHFQCLELDVCALCTFWYLSRCAADTHHSTKHESSIFRARRKNSNNNKNCHANERPNRSLSCSKTTVCKRSRIIGRILNTLDSMVISYIKMRKGGENECVYNVTH